MNILVDSCVLLDVLTNDPQWADWSAGQIDLLAGEHRLPDFYIGAHAAIGGMTLLTRDPSRYRTHFPRLPLICP